MVGHIDIMVHPPGFLRHRRTANVKVERSTEAWVEIEAETVCWIGTIPPVEAPLLRVQGVAVASMILLVLELETAAKEGLLARRR